MAFQIGEKAECSFETSVSKAGLSCEKSSFPEEMRHIDFWIEGNKTPRTAVDVKSRKKVKRADDKFNDEVVWIEFANVQGKRGWLYGDSDIIAFERPEDFLLVNRKLLARLWRKAVRSLETKRRYQNASLHWLSKKRPQRSSFFD